MKIKQTRRMNGAMRLGLVIIVFFLAVALLAPVLAPYNPYTLGVPYQKPGVEHLLGTNDVGQDIFSELLYGTRVSLSIGVFAALLVMVLATLLALVSGYYRGWADTAVTAVTNLAMGLPDLALTVLLVAYLNPGKLSIVIAIAVTAWTGTARLLRSRVISLCELPFVKIEKAMGVSSLQIMVKHILPNLKDLVLTRAAQSVSFAIMTETGLSFLGLGDYGAKSWGGILHYAFYQNGVIRGHVWWYLPPILCTTALVLGFMLVGYYGLQRGGGRHA